MEPRPTTSKPDDGTDPQLGRRGFLGMIGVGVGTLAVAGAAGLTWKAIDGGIFASGTGPAYAAWDALNAPSEATLALVSAAVLAANAHNTQPWLFRVAPDRVDLFADTTRTLGAMDPLGRELDLTLGCAVENLVLAAPVRGTAATVTLLPEPADSTHIARVDLRATDAAVSPLYAAIAQRHTNRGAYDTARAVRPAQLAALGALLDAPGAELVWFTTDAAKTAFGDLTLRATEAIIADRQQSADDYVWYRSSWDEIQAKKDGITIDPSGQTPLIRALSKIIPVSQQQNSDGWLKGMRTIQIPTAAAFGAIVVREPADRGNRLAAGRAWQRMHLSATTQGLAMQPLCQVPERIDREASASLRADFAPAMAALLPSGTRPLMTFRIGYPTMTALPSPRRPAHDVVL
ncbi:MAG: Acg family FMN-binding oxidoreductase [Cellulomonas sp.]